MENFKIKSLAEHKLKAIDQSGQTAAAKPKLLDQVRTAIWTRHYYYAFVGGRI